MEPVRPGGRCEAFRAAMDVLGKPWNGLLLKELQAGPLRFSVLAERIAVGDRMLSCRLKELEAAGLVSREVDPGPPVRVSYALTEVGQGIGDVARAVEDWGERVLTVRAEHTEAPSCGGAEEGESSLCASASGSSAE